MDQTSALQSYLQVWMYVQFQLSMQQETCPGRGRNMFSLDATTAGGLCKVTTAGGATSNHMPDRLLSYRWLVLRSDPQECVLVDPAQDTIKVWLKILGPGPCSMTPGAIQQGVPAKVRRSLESVIGKFMLSEVQMDHE